MTARELKNIFVNFFLSKNHQEIPSASLIPENDPTTLFISAGMHPLVPHLLGQAHPLGKRLVSVQKCLRTGDIDSVGDTFHHTFFEMLGNWSLGDYFKKEMIPWSYEFLTQKLQLDPNRLEVTCFVGDTDAPKDEESARLWQSTGISQNRIRFLTKKDNWWGPAGETGPCGPDSEMFFDGLEIWNDVFMEFNKNKDGSFSPLKQKNVDTGMGVERTVAILSRLSDNYLSNIWQPIITQIEKLSNQNYSNNPVPFRIIADHLRASVFVIADGVEPSNKERGYVLRRLIRRSIRQGKLLGLEQNFCAIIAKSILANQSNYAGIYPELDQNSNKILETLDLEETKFRKTLNNGLRQINKLISQNHNLTGQQAFDLYQSYGFPVELIQEELQKNHLSLNITDFNNCLQQHINQSRTLSSGKFKSGLVDHSQISAKYHTATHLLHASLRQLLGNHVEQAGSNITPQRLRFDFIHHQKLTEKQLNEISNLVNQKIQASLPVTTNNMSLSDAQKSGALSFFGNKYPNVVSVYSIGEFSKEICAGPHVNNTAELGTFRIIKEESAGANKRRLYASLK